MNMWHVILVVYLVLQILSLVGPLAVTFNHFMERKYLTSAESFISFWVMIVGWVFFVGFAINNLILFEMVIK